MAFSHILFTNDQLAQVATHRVTSLQKLSEIRGIGKAKSEKYGQQIVEIVANYVQTEEGP